MICRLGKLSVSCHHFFHLIFTKRSIEISYRLFFFFKLMKMWWQDTESFSANYYNSDRHSVWPAWVSLHVVHLQQALSRFLFHVRWAYYNINVIVLHFLIFIIPCYLCQAIKSKDNIRPNNKKYQLIVRIFLERGGWGPYYLLFTKKNSRWALSISNKKGHQF